MTDPQRYQNALAEVAEASRWFKRRHPRMAAALHEAYLALDELAIEHSRMAAKLEDIAARKWIDEKMSASMTHASSPDHWVGWLAASIGGYLNNQQTIEQLDDDYRLFLASPLVTPELRRILPPPRKRKKSERT